MRDVNKPDRVLPPRTLDGYAQFSAARVEIEMIGGMEHMGAGQPELWWLECLAWLARDYPRKTPK